MATAMVYDTLKLADQLEHEAGFDAPRAKAMARILAESAGGNLATREDILVTKGELQAETQGVRNEIQRVKSELNSAIQAVKEELRSEIGGLRDELRREVQGLKAQIQDVRGDIRVLYWMTGTTLAGVAALLSIAIAIGLHITHLG